MTKNKVIIKKEYIKPVVVIISGYFNPIHRGHIDYIKEAKRLGDLLIVIVNNDKQVGIKGSTRFQEEDERMYILSNIKGVDLVLLSKDKDATVCESIKLIKEKIDNRKQLYSKIIFAKGGDRTLDNIPEASICKMLGIEMIFNIGGKKTQSSSELISKVK